MKPYPFGTVSRCRMHSYCDLTYDHDPHLSTLITINRHHTTTLTFLLLMLYLIVLKSNRKIVELLKFEYEGTHTTVYLLVNRDTLFLFSSFIQRQRLAYHINIIMC